jgi:hypothetical protein
MKKVYSTILVLAMLFLPMQMHAEGSSIKLEFSDTSMTIELSEKPKIVTDDGELLLKTSSMTVALALPCKVTSIGVSDIGDDGIISIRNNNDNAPINVFSLDGIKVGTLKDKNEVLSLERGVYIINGKKVFIK